MKSEQSITTRLRVRRAEHRVSQMQAARHLGCGHNRYWRIENGYQEPTEDEKVMLASLLKCRVSDIFPKRAA